MWLGVAVALTAAEAIPVCWLLAELREAWRQRPPSAR